MHIVNFGNRYPGFEGDTLSFWCYSPEAIAETDLPLLTLANLRWGLQVTGFPGFSQALQLGKYVANGVPAGHWVQVHIPPAEFHSASIFPFQSSFFQNMIFHQGKADGSLHTLIVDEIRIDNGYAMKTAAPSAKPLPVPQNVHAKGYDRHIEVSWDAPQASGVARYIIYRSLNGGKFEPVGIQVADAFRYNDFLGKSGVKAE